MRLRYLRLQNYPPIVDTSTCFASRSPLQLECAIRFVVGLNGSGKSHLLRALSEVFLALSDRALPRFGCSLIYELGRRGQSGHKTVLLDCTTHENAPNAWIAEGYAWSDETDTEDFDVLLEECRSGNPPKPLIEIGSPVTWSQTGVLEYTPKRVLAYTTGAMQPWRDIWERSDSYDAEVSPDDETDLERPFGWTFTKEMASKADDKTAPSAEDHSQIAELEGFLKGNEEALRRPLLLDSDLLKCALLVVALPEVLASQNAITTTPNDALRDLLRDLLKRGNWQTPVSIAFRMKFKPENWSRALSSEAQKWILCANEVISEPSPSDTRTLHFDLNGTFNNQTLENPEDGTNDFANCQTPIQALWVLLGGQLGQNFKTIPPFQCFSRLIRLRRTGLFESISISLRKTNSADILNFDELSDGEQMVLGRMALFHLLSGQDDALLLLDEPETHFNDKWKRDIIDIVDSALGTTANEIMISTHASLVLTDALKNEIVQLKDSQFQTLGDEIRTFGATSDHPLRDVFGAADTVGLRASKLLEVLLAAAVHAEAVEAFWAGESNDVVARVLETASKTEENLTFEIVKTCLDRVAYFAEYFGVEKPIKMDEVIKIFIIQTGAGYFQIELMRAWQQLHERLSHVA